MGAADVEKTWIETWFRWLGLLFFVIGWLLVTINVIGLIMNTLSKGFNEAQAIATAGSSEPGQILVIGLGLLFGAEVLRRLREIASK
jgi:hypothetical protein